MSVQHVNIRQIMARFVVCYRPEMNEYDLYAHCRKRTLQVNRQEFRVFLKFSKFSWQNQ